MKSETKIIDIRSSSFNAVRVIDGKQYILTNIKYDGTKEGFDKRANRIKNIPDQMFIDLINI